MRNLIVQFLTDNNIPFEKDVDLKRKTWIHRGGRASLFITPRGAEELEKITSYLYYKQVHFFLFGHTSNLYIKNECNLDVVVSTIKCTSVVVTETNICCDAGTSVIKLSHQMIERGICGFEYLTELPGTVGAALVNNSSCKTNSISKLLVEARCLFPDGTIKNLVPGDFNFHYRTSDFKSRHKVGTILSVTLKRINGDANCLKQIAIANKKDREMRLGAHSNNLGCAVNSNGAIKKMSLKYYVPLTALKLWGKLVKEDHLKTNSRINHVLCKLAHCRGVERYISPYNPIVFIWKDEGADKVFPSYLDYMNRVYNYNSLEIQIIE